MPTGPHKLGKVQVVDLAHAHRADDDVVGGTGTVEIVRHSRRRKYRISCDAMGTPIW
jgi:hypothetical protein